MHSHGTRPRPHGWPVRLGAVGLFIASLACSGSFSSFFGSEPVPSDLAQARQELADGRLPEATTSFRTLHEAHPASIDAASGYAYTLLLAGQLEQADAVLAQVDFGSAEIALRRALLALRRGDLDQVRDLGLASGLPAGQLMAAEVRIIDLELEPAIATLTGVAAGEGVEATTARDYLDLLQHEDPLYQSLANPVALWSLGKRQDACEGAESFLGKMDATPERSEALLLWSGRAVTSGLAPLARSMIDEVVSLPKDQQWRKIATEALIDIAEGESERGLATFQRLRTAKGVPADGLDDARVTACSLARDEATASALVQGLNSPGAARCLMQVGANDAARTRNAGPALGRLLENL